MCREHSFCACLPTTPGGKHPAGRKNRGAMAILNSTLPNPGIKNTGHARTLWQFGEVSSQYHVQCSEVAYLKLKYFEMVHFLPTKRSTRFLRNDAMNRPKIEHPSLSSLYFHNKRKLVYLFFIRRITYGQTRNQLCGIGLYNFLLQSTPLQLPERLPSPWSHQELSSQRGTLSTEHMQKNRQRQQFDCL